MPPVVKAFRSCGHRRCATLNVAMKKAPEGALFRSGSVPPHALHHLILASLNSTCLRATGSYFFTAIFSVIVRVFFFVT